MSNMLVMEIDTPHNGNLTFLPINEVIRGRFELQRVKEPRAMEFQERYGLVIPGQHIRVDLDTGELQIHETLWDEENRDCRTRIERLKKAVPPEGTKRKVHLPTTLFWLKKALDGKIARLVEGSAPFPAKIEGTPRVSALTRTDTEMERATQAKTLDILASLQAELLSMKQDNASLRNEVVALQEAATSKKK